MAKSRMISSLRERLALEAYELIPAGMGSPAHRSWQNLATIWASIETIAADQTVSAGQMGQTLTHRVVIRFRSDIDTSKRFRWGQRIFLVRTVYDEEGRKRWLICLCEEIRA
jgi:SPP1 family predicted phage head-tail adaptor